MDSYSRVRSVKLQRSSEEAPFGFSVRGGHEHGTGIFVSFVDPRSIAFKQGLRVGDQILRVNGFPVSAALHHETLNLMKVRPSLHLKVRKISISYFVSVNGQRIQKLYNVWCTFAIETVKNEIIRAFRYERRVTMADAIILGASAMPSLDLVDGGIPNAGRGQSRLSDTSSQPDAQIAEAKVFIDITGHAGLGCCICKGPPERPGIFVQSTKSSGVAREAGLRPGDQLLSCNGHSFLQIPFAEAVYYLKSSKQLKLRVLKGVATDLFPGESSGYNSSASSLNGDHAPSPSNSAEVIVHEQNSGSHESAHRRLTSVTEEAGGCNSVASNNTENVESVPLDGGMEWDEVEQVWRSAERETIVIEVKGVDHSTRSEEQRLAEERRKLEETQRRLMEETIKLDEEKRQFEEEKRRTLLHSSASNSVTSTISNGESTTAYEGVGPISTLAGALSQEIHKRNERRESSTQGKDDDRPKPGIVEQKRSLFNSQIDQEKRQQHEQLIEEFKRAHRKMFAHTLVEEANKECEAADQLSASAVVRNRRVQKELDHERQMVAQRVAGIVRQRQLRIERQYQECAETEREIRSKSPPPPPPMPANRNSPLPKSRETSAPKFTKKSPAPLAPSLLQVQSKHVIIEENTLSPQPLPTITASNASISKKGQAPPPPAPQRAGSELQKPQKPGVPRPESPSPDYSNSPSPIPSPSRTHKPKPIGVDMQSLESFRLKDPPRSIKKHPPVYFAHNNQPGNNQVRMSAYPSVYNRNEPGRLEFIDTNTNSDILIQKELEDALARCNLTNANKRPNGGILKIGTNSSAPNNSKTISFGKY